MTTNDGKPLITVSIVTYHSDIEQLRAAVASVSRQNIAHEIIIVDCASAKEYQAQLQEFEGDAKIILSDRNGGFGYGHNLAMLEAGDSNYFLVLNPDVVLHDNALLRLVEFMQQTPKAGVVAPKVFYPDGRLQSLNKREPNVLDLGLRLILPNFLSELPLFKRRLMRYSMLDVGYEHSYSLPFASGCCMLFKSEIIHRLGGFDEGFFLYFEDADICRRVWEVAEVWFCAQAHITHAWQRASRKSRKMLWIMLKSAGRYFTKWGWKLY
jgi:GT2 family glycosyltransferase